MAQLILGLIMIHSLHQQMQKQKRAEVILKPGHHHTLPHQVLQKMQTVSKQGDIWLSYQFYDDGDQDFIKIQDSVMIWNAKAGLYLNNNSMPRIIQYIHNISFPFLTSLILHSNRIESLEHLTRMRFPSLEKLAINSNCISNLSAFHKICASNLKELYCCNPVLYCIENNQISEYMTLAYLNTPQIKVLNLRMKSDYKVVFKFGWSTLFKTVNEELKHRVLDFRLLSSSETQAFYRKFNSVGSFQ